MAKPIQNIMKNFHKQKHRIEYTQDCVLIKILIKNTLNLLFNVHTGYNTTPLYVMPYDGTPDKKKHTHTHKLVYVYEAVITIPFQVMTRRCHQCVLKYHKLNEKNVFLAETETRLLVKLETQQCVASVTGML
jgi:hypothetical protein